MSVENQFGLLSRVVPCVLTLQLMVWVRAVMQPYQLIWGM